MVPPTQSKHLLSPRVSRMGKSSADRAFLQMCEDQALLDNFTKTTDEQSRLIKEADDEQYMKDCLEVSSFP